MLPKRYARKLYDGFVYMHHSCMVNHRQFNLFLELRRWVTRNKHKQLK